MCNRPSQIISYWVGRFFIKMGALWGMPVDGDLEMFKKINLGIEEIIFISMSSILLFCVGFVLIFGEITSDENNLPGDIIKFDSPKVRRIIGSTTGLKWVEFKVSFDFLEPPFVLYAEVPAKYRGKVLVGLIYSVRKGKFVTEGMFSKGEISGADWSAIYVLPEVNLDELEFLIRIRPTKNGPPLEKITKNPAEFVVLKVDRAPFNKSD